MSIYSRLASFSIMVLVLVLGLYGPSAAEGTTDINDPPPRPFFLQDIQPVARNYVFALPADALATLDLQDYLAQGQDELPVYLGNVQPGDTYKTQVWIPASNSELQHEFLSLFGRLSELTPAERKKAKDMFPELIYVPTIPNPKSPLPEPIPKTKPPTEPPRCQDGKVLPGFCRRVTQPLEVCQCN